MRNPTPTQIHSLVIIQIALQLLIVVAVITSFKASLFVVSSAEISSVAVVMAFEAATIIAFAVEA